MRFNIKHILYILDGVKCSDNGKIQHHLCNETLPKRNVAENYRAPKAIRINSETWQFGPGWWLTVEI